MTFLTLWAINARLEEGRLCRQLDAMRAGGFDGVVWHPRFYPNEPPYLSDRYLAILSAVILHARSIGMEFWIYDENGWPSGSVGGEMLRCHPDCRQQWKDSSGRISYGAGVDYLNPDLARHFLAMTYERYRQGLSQAAWDHVTTFFCDEPEFGLGHAYDLLPTGGAIPWTSGLTVSFPQSPDEKIKFWESLTDRFCESFLAPLNNWCQDHGKRFTAHVKGEEHPLFQVPMVGSCHQAFQHLSLPGIDALERFPSGHFFPRQVASAAQQFGTGDCMVECFGGAGWGASPEDLEQYLNWLADHGLTHFVTHLYQHQLTTAAIQDWPPSHPAHMTWSEVVPSILERVRRRADQPRPQAQTLVVAPYRGIMAQFDPGELLQMNIHNGSTYADTAAGRLNRQFLELLDRVHQSGEPYHVSDERSVEQHGRMVEGHLQLGRCTYSKVIVADGAMLDGVAGEPWQPQPARETVEVSSCPAIVPVVWELASDLLNDLVLDSEPQGDGQFLVRLDSVAPFDAELWFADEVSDVSLNGVPLQGNVLPREHVRAHNEVRFACTAPVTSPFVSVHGRFLVKSLSPWEVGPNGTIRTAGPFRIEPAIGSTLADYPFCRKPLTIRGQFSGSGSWLQLIGGGADAAQVFVNGTECGWTWGPDWAVSLPPELSDGIHQIEVRLIPSTYNIFGPHHHLDGDRHIVSPSQFSGHKNFADHPDAPEHTRVLLWHVKPLRLPSGIALMV